MAPWSHGVPQRRPEEGSQWDLGGHTRAAGRSRAAPLPHPGDTQLGTWAGHRGRKAAPGQQFPASPRALPWLAAGPSPASAGRAGWGCQRAWRPRSAQPRKPGADTASTLLQVSCPGLSCPAPPSSAGPLGPWRIPTSLARGTLFLPLLATCGVGGALQRQGPPWSWAAVGWAEETAHTPPASTCAKPWAACTHAHRHTPSTSATRCSWAAYAWLRSLPQGHTAGGHHAPTQGLKPRWEGQSPGTCRGAHEVGQVSPRMCGGARLWARPFLTPQPRGWGRQGQGSGAAPACARPGTFQEAGALLLPSSPPPGRLWQPLPHSST